MLGEKPDPDIKVRTLLDRAAEKIEGSFKDQPRVEAAIRKTIGEAYFALGLFHSAGVHIDRSLEINLPGLGTDHPAVLNMLRRNAIIELKKGRFSEAERHGMEALSGLRRVLGEAHRDTIACMHSLTLILLYRGKLSDAEVLGLTAARLATKAFGEDDFLTQVSLDELSYVYDMEGRFDESEAMLRKSLEVARRLRGEEHPLVIDLMARLAWSTQMQGRYAEAVELSSRAMECGLRTRKDDPFFISTCSAIRGAACNKAGFPAFAEELLSSAVDGFRKCIGPEHEDTLWAEGLLADSYLLEGRLREAEMILTRVLPACRRNLGNSHFVTLDTVSLLAETHLLLGRAEEAEFLLFEVQRVGSGPEAERSPGIAEVASLLARLRLARSAPEESEGLARRALAIRMDRHPDHWTRFDALSLLGASLAGQGKLAEAESMLLEAYNGLKERQERIPYLWRKKRPAEAAGRLVELYEALGKKDLADEWRKRVDLEAELPAEVFAP
jgi:tetratricopeptide (TPR) repeat protein